MRLVDRLRQLDDRVGFSAAPSRWQVGEADPPRWARAAATHRVRTALLLGAGVGSSLALLWTLTDPSFEVSNLLARMLLVVPVAFLGGAFVVASVADRVELVERLRRSEVGRTPREG